MKILVIGLGATPNSRSKMMMASLVSMNFSDLEARYMSAREYEEVRNRGVDTYHDECLGFDPEALSYFGGVEQLSPVVAVSPYQEFTWERPTLRKPKPYYVRGRW